MPCFRLLHAGGIVQHFVFAKYHGSLVQRGVNVPYISLVYCTAFHCHCRVDIVRYSPFLKTIGVSRGFFNIIVA